MEIDKREEEQHDWTGYGSAERPVIVTYYHVEDDHGVHRLSINDYAIWDPLGIRRHSNCTWPRATARLSSWGAAR